MHCTVGMLSWLKHGHASLLDDCVLHHESCHHVVLLAGDGSSGLPNHVCPNFKPRRDRSRGRGRGRASLIQYVHQAALLAGRRHGRGGWRHFPHYHNRGRRPVKVVTGRSQRNCRPGHLAHDGNGGGRVMKVVCRTLVSPLCWLPRLLPHTLHDAGQ